MPDDVPACCPTKEVHDQKVASSLSGSVKDAAANNAMNGTAVNYIQAFAIYLQATPIQLSLLSSIPSLLAALANLLSVQLMALFEGRSKAIAVLVLLQSFTFLPMIIIAYYFSGQNAVWLLILFYTLFLVFGATVSPIWQSLMGDLIPLSIRGQFFAHRNAAGGLTALGGTLLAGFILGWVPTGHSYAAFALLFSLGFLFRMISWHYLRSAHDPPYFSPPEAQFTFKQFVAHMNETNFGHFVVYASLFSFAVGVASPFFSLYMLRDLGFDYWTYSIISISSMLSSLIVVIYWGQIADRFGNRLILSVCGFFIALIPLLYVFFPAPLFILIFEFFITGLFWAGFNLAVVNFIFDTTTAPKRARCSSYFMAFSSLGAFAGALVGGFFLSIIPPSFIWFTALQWLFILSFILRLTIHIFFLKLIHEVRPVDKMREGELVFGIMTGKPFLGFAIETVHLVQETTRTGVFQVMMVEKSFKTRIHQADMAFEAVLGYAVADADKLLNQFEKKKKTEPLPKI